MGGDTGTFGIGIGPTGGSGGFLLGAYLTGTAAPSTFTLYDLTGYTALSGVSSVDLDPVSQNGNNFAITAITVSYETVPEPMSVSLFAAGAIGLAAARRRRA